MKYAKIICTHKWGNNATRDEHTSSNGFVISGGSYSRSLEFFIQLASEAKRDFPFLADNAIEPIIIVRSSCMEGLVGVRFPLPAGTDSAEYHKTENVDFGLA